MAEKKKLENKASKPKSDKKSTPKKEVKVLKVVNGRVVVVIDGLDYAVSAAKGAELVNKGTAKYK